MNIDLLGGIAIVAYLIGGVLSAKKCCQKLLFASTILGLVLHSFVLWDLVILNWVNLSFYHALSFASIFTLFSVFLAHRWYSLPSLLVIVLPLSALALWLEITHPEGIHQQANIYLDTHILFSILAYSFLFVGAILTIISFVQEKLLKTKKLTGLLQALPPLIEIETALFKTLTVGFLLLTVSLLSGFIFLEDIFNQHLAHKTFFSILSWHIFALLLLGRHKYGWRGKLATRLTLIGFTLILLAYFGSKIVREFLLSSV